MNNVVMFKEASTIDNDAIAAEQAYLAAILMAPQTYTPSASMIKEEYFLHPTHKMIFKAFIDCKSAGLSGDLVEVSRSLGVKADFDLGDGTTLKNYMVRLSSEAITFSTAAYAKTIRDYWALRQIQNVASKVSQGGLPDKIIDEAFEIYDDIRCERADAGCSSADLETLCMKVAKEAEEIATGRKQEPGLTTGIPELDDTILGFRPGELVVIAGRPGMGKSTVATSLALAASRTARGGRAGGVGFLGLELGENAIGSRLLADLCSDNRDAPTHSSIRSGRLTDDQISILANATHRIKEHSLLIDYRSSATVSDIESICRSWKQKLEREGQRLDVIFIDYIKQVKTSDRYRGNRVYEIGEITADLRDIAKRLQLCVVLLVQLNREVEKRENKRPSLADLRESGDIENDADVVMIIYREAYYLKKEMKETLDSEKWTELNNRLRQTENIVELLIEKNRNGEGSATVIAACDIAHSAIRPLHKGGF